MTEILNAQEFGPATEEQVRALEQELGTSLPSDYRSFLLEINGGIPSPENFAIPELGEKMTIETFFGLHDGPPHVSLRHFMTMWQVLLPDCLPIGYEQGGNPLCLKLRGDGTGEVRLWDIPVDKLMSKGTPTTFYRLAGSFREFFECLR